MKPQPFYTPSNLYRCAYSLRCDWSGWPSNGARLPKITDQAVSELDQAWEKDGIRRLETEWAQGSAKVLFSVKPTVDPVFFASRVKGRLQHVLSKSGQPTKFSRKVGFRTVGENSIETVETYIKNQVPKAQFVDSEFAERLVEFTHSNELVNLREPTKTGSGRYWYDLHLVLVTEQREKQISYDYLRIVSESLDRIAQKKNHAISLSSLMPDHLHMALRGNINSSPEKIALDFMNNTSFKVGWPIWRPSYYAGTNGAYDQGAIRLRFR